MFLKYYYFQLLIFFFIKKEIAKFLNKQNIFILVISFSFNIYLMIQNKYIIQNKFVLSKNINNS